MFKSDLVQTLAPTENPNSFKYPFCSVKLADCEFLHQILKGLELQPGLNTDHSCLLKCTIYFYDLTPIILI